MKFKEILLKEIYSYTLGLPNKLEMGIFPVIISLDGEDTITSPGQAETKTKKYKIIPQFSETESRKKLGKAIIKVLYCYPTKKNLPKEKFNELVFLAIKEECPEILKLETLKDEKNIDEYSSIALSFVYDLVPIV